MLDHDLRQRLRDRRAMFVVFGVLTVGALIFNLLGVPDVVDVFLAVQVIIVFVRALNLSADLYELKITDIDHVGRALEKNKE